MKAIIECRKEGVALLRGAAADDFVERERAWTKGALEEAAPWPALQALLEPIGDIGPEEGRQAIGVRVQTVAQAQSAIWLAVRLYRIQVWLKAQAMTPAPRREPSPDYIKRYKLTRQLARARVEAKKGASERGAAKIAVDALGHGGAPSWDRAFDVVRKAIKV